MTTFADLKRLRKPARASIVLQLDGELRDREAALRRQIAALRQQATLGQVSDTFMGLADGNGGGGQLADLELELQQLREEAEASEVTFTFQAIGHSYMEELQLAHPPTAAQKRDNYQHNPDTFGPALVAACLVEPDLTEAEVRELWREWSPGMVNTLWRSAWDLCHVAQVAVPLSGNGSERMPSSALS